MIATTTKNKVTWNIVSAYEPKFEKNLKVSEQTKNFHDQLSPLINKKKKQDVIIITEKFGQFFKIFQTYVWSHTTATSVLMPLSRLAGVGNFCLALAIFFDRTHPLFSSHIVPNPSLHTLPTIFLVDPFSFSQIFQLP